MGLVTYDSANSIYGSFLGAIVSHRERTAKAQSRLTIIRAAQYPGELVMEEDSADIVQMAVQCEQASPGLI